MNTSEMKSKASEINSELNNTNYDNFAIKHRKTHRPEKFTSSFSKLIDKLFILVCEASDKFPQAQVDKLFEEGRELLDFRTRAIKNNDFEKGKAILLETISIIEQNLIKKEEEPKDKNPSKNLILNQSKLIFVSYYNQQILDQMKVVFGMLGQLDSSMSDLQYVEREQSDSLNTVTSRIDDIRSCSSAIICLPPQNLSEATTNVLAYLDLGACLALFGEQILLIHEGNRLPNTLASKVQAFHYLGKLDLKKGMELARQILKVVAKR